MMPTDNSERAIERAIWLASVGAALDEAQRLAARLADLSPASPEAAELRWQIAAVRREVEISQRATPAPPQRDKQQPFW